MGITERKIRITSILGFGVFLFGAALTPVRADLLGEVARAVLEGNQVVNTSTAPPSNTCQNQVSPASSNPAADPAQAIQAITALSTQYPACSKYSWKKRGQAPQGFIEGLLLVYARSVCEPNRADVLVVSDGKRGDKTKDALTVYDAQFAKLPQANLVNRNTANRTGESGVTTLRKVYTLLMGLGMMESAGIPNVGRHMEDPFSTADSAEAGPFQASWGASRTSEVLAPLLATYQKSPPPQCFFETFHQGVSATIQMGGHRASVVEGWKKNWGSESELGFQWQKTTKECPAFAVEYAAVLLRTHGGSKGEFNPLRKKQVEVNQDCYGLLAQVEKVVRDQPELCHGLAQSTPNSSPTAR